MTLDILSWNCKYVQIPIPISLRIAFKFENDNLNIRLTSSRYNSYKQICSLRTYANQVSVGFYSFNFQLLLKLF